MCLGMWMWEREMGNEREENGSGDCNMQGSSTRNVAIFAYMCVNMNVYMYVYGYH